MTVSQLIEVLINGINEGTIDKDGEILAAMVNGAYQADEEQIFDAMEDENNCEGLYLLTSNPSDDCNVLLYPHLREKEEEPRE